MNIEQKDYGCDPLPDGMFQMVPSGQVVSKEEKERILSGLRKSYQYKNDCLGLSWEKIEQMQGGKLKRP